MILALCIPKVRYLAVVDKCKDCQMHPQSVKLYPVASNRLNDTVQFLCIFGIYHSSMVLFSNVYIHVSELRILSLARINKFSYILL